MHDNAFKQLQIYTANSVADRMEYDFARELPNLDRR